MTIEHAFKDFLRELNVKTNTPATEAQLAAAEAKLGVVLPTSLRECYRTCDGGQAQGGRSALQLFSLKTSLEYANIPGFLDSFWSFFPFADNHDSNPICVCCKSPLAGYLVQVHHDDSSRLKFRSLKGFFHGTIDYIQGGRFLDTDAMPSEFAGSTRTESDRAIARELIDLATRQVTLNDQERTDALRFACDLLSDDDVDEIGGLLKFEDTHVREHLVNRLKGISGAKAARVLHQFEGEFDTFLERCAQTLRRAGILASVHPAYGKKTISIEPGPVWLNMEVLYCERNRADFETYLVERARYFVAPKN